MGLDAVELVMAIEEKFGISISDEEAQDLRTVGKMFECVVSKVTVSDRSSCLTQTAFHLLRRSAKELFKVPRNLFRPNTELDLIVPRLSRRQAWRKLQLAVGATNWPKLSLSWLGVVALLILIFAIPGLAFEYVMAVLRWNVVASGIIAVVVMAAAIRAGKLVADPFGVEFRGGITTVRDLAYVVVAENPELFGTDRATWTNEEMWSLLSSVIREQTRVSQFTKDSRFVEELKID